MKKLLKWLVVVLALVGAGAAWAWTAIDIAATVPGVGPAVATVGALVSGNITPGLGVTGAALNVLGGLVLFLVVMVLICLLLAAVMFVSMLSTTIIYTGLCLGPILLFLSPIQLFRGMIPQYLKFMITAVFYKLVCACFVVLASKGLHYAALTDGSGAPSFSLMLGIAIVMVVLIAIMKAAPSVASSLVGGFSMNAST